MKHYEFGTWGIGFIWALEGSVFPKAFAWALPCSVIAVTFWYSFNKDIGVDTKTLGSIEDITTSQIWVGYNWVLGFLVSFRATRAYARWWEGGTLLQQARGEWFNAYSSLIAFSSDVPEKKGDVEQFQQLLARLVSMLYGAALQTVSMSENLNFELIDFAGVDKTALLHLLEKPDKCEIILQWIQRLIVININNGVVPIAPPILSRAFQELSRGIVNMHNVRKITEFQFPFPFAQMITTMLLVQWMVTPFATAMCVGSPSWAALLSFVPVFAFWGINYIAAEIEQPFGDDSNDMPMVKMQSSMNASILALLEEKSQNPPNFTLVPRIDSQDAFGDATRSVAALTLALHKLRIQNMQVPEEEILATMTSKSTNQTKSTREAAARAFRSVRFSETDRITIQSSLKPLIPPDTGSPHRTLARSSTGISSGRGSSCAAFRPSYIVHFNSNRSSQRSGLSPAVTSSMSQDGSEKYSKTISDGSKPSLGKRKNDLRNPGTAAQPINGVVGQLHTDGSKQFSDGNKQCSFSWELDNQQFSDGKLPTVHSFDSLDVRSYLVADGPEDQLLARNAPLRTIHVSPGKSYAGREQDHMCVPPESKVGMPKSFPPRLMEQAT